jgi:hypothetical protein
MINSYDRVLTILNNGVPEYRNKTVRQIEESEDTNSPGYHIHWSQGTFKSKVSKMSNTDLLDTLRYCIINRDILEHTDIPELKSINGKSFEEWVEILTAEYKYRKEKQKQQKITELKAEYEELKSREEKKADVVAKLKNLGVDV